MPIRKTSRIFSSWGYGNRLARGTFVNGAGQGKWEVPRRLRVLKSHVCIYMWPRGIRKSSRKVFPVNVNPVNGTRPDATAGRVRCHRLGRSLMTSLIRTRRGSDRPVLAAGDFWTILT
ncbi:hypothetical protein AMTR_s00001p00098160 [Amborella trichopoda]|uniref:Uncharacterized protein n=1 Tax=Amborella trichopoda TaxID=13333 RepID=W1NL55_AMBTC|nr:hypothetical protein AMTR_s00001p00098160 [Amborella trichopoda]